MKKEYSKYNISDISTFVAHKLYYMKLTKKQTKEIIKATFECIKSILEEGDIADIQDFGQFKLKYKPYRQPTVSYDFYRKTHWIVPARMPFNAPECSFKSAFKEDLKKRTYDNAYYYGDDEEEDYHKRNAEMEEFFYSDDFDIEEYVNAKKNNR